MRRKKSVDGKNPNITSMQKHLDRISENMQKVETFISNDQTRYND